MELESLAALSNCFELTVGAAMRLRSRAFGEINGMAVKKLNSPCSS